MQVKEIDIINVTTHHNYNKENLVAKYPYVLDKESIPERLKRTIRSFENANLSDEYFQKLLKLANACYDRQGFLTNGQLSVIAFQY